jgi:hypothetical protein
VFSIAELEGFDWAWKIRENYDEAVRIKWKSVRNFELKSRKPKRKKERKKESMIPVG